MKKLLSVLLTLILVIFPPNQVNTDNVSNDYIETNTVIETAVAVIEEEIKVEEIVEETVEIIEQPIIKTVEPIKETKIVEPEPIQEEIVEEVVDEVVIEEVVEESIKYASVLYNSNIQPELGTPQYSKEQIQEMIDNNWTLQEVADNLSTLADVLQYLQLKGFTAGSKQLHLFDANDFHWSINYSARAVFDLNCGCCGGCSNLLNYLLVGDYDSQGYIHEGANVGGHVFNWFKVDDSYYFFDLISIIWDYNNGYSPIQVSSPSEFSSRYIECNHNNCVRENNYDMYLILQYMYASDTSHAPITYQIINGKFNNYIAGLTEDEVIVLYKDKEDMCMVYKPAIPLSYYPAGAK